MDIYAVFQRVSSHVWFDIKVSTRWLMMIKCVEMHEIRNSFIGCLNCPEQITASHVSHKEIIVSHVGVMTSQCEVKNQSKLNFK